MSDAARVFVQRFASKIRLRCVARGHAFSYRLMAAGVAHAGPGAGLVLDLMREETARARDRRHLAKAVEAILLER